MSNMANHGQPHSRASVLEILLRHFIFRPLEIRPDCMSSIGAKRSHVESLKSFRHTGSGLLVCRTTAGAAVKLFKVGEMKESRPAASSRGLEKATSGRDSFISPTLKSLTAAPAVVLQTRSPLPVWRNDFEECASVFLTSLRHWTTLSVTHWRKLKSHPCTPRSHRRRLPVGPLPRPTFWQRRAAKKGKESLSHYVTRMKSNHIFAFVAVASTSGRTLGLR